MPNVLQWNPSITDTIGNQNFVRNSEVSLTHGLPVYSGRCGMRNWAVERNVAAFSELSLCCTLAGNSAQRLVLRVTALI